MAHADAEAAASTCLPTGILRQCCATSAVAMRHHCHLDRSGACAMVSTKHLWSRVGARSGSTAKPWMRKAAGGARQQPQAMAGPRGVPPRQCAAPGRQQ